MRGERPPFRVALIQMRCSTDPDDNLRRAWRCLREAASEGAQVACLPELFRTQYFCQTEDAATFDLAEPIPGPTTEALAERGARDRDGRSSARSSSGGRRGSTTTRRSCSTPTARSRGRYRKMHIPDDPLYYEKYYFTPGDLGLPGVRRRAHASVGTLVCWDQWYPEAARLTALQGPEVLFYPTAIGWHPSEKAEFGEAQADAWETMQRAHAIANGVFVAAVNRIGHEGPADGGLEFWGGVVPGRPVRPDPRQGEPRHARRSSSSTCDPKLQEETRRNWPFLRDRRIDAYGPITQRFLDVRLTCRGLCPSTDRYRRPHDARRAWLPACPPNGSPTRRPGSPGPTTATTGPASSRRSPGSTPRSSDI